MGLSHLESYSSLFCALHRISWCCKTVSLCRAGRGVGSQNQSRIQQQKCQGKKIHPAGRLESKQAFYLGKGNFRVPKSRAYLVLDCSDVAQGGQKEKTAHEGTYMTSQSKEKLLHPSSLYAQQQLQETGVKKTFLNFYHIKK